MNFNYKKPTGLGSQQQENENINMTDNTRKYDKTTNQKPIYVISNKTTQSPQPQLLTISTGV